MLGTAGFRGAGVQSDHEDTEEVNRIVAEANKIASATASLPVVCALNFSCSLGIILFAGGRAKFEERWRADRLKPLLKPLLACSSARCTRSPERHSLPSPVPTSSGPPLIPAGQRRAS